MYTGRLFSSRGHTQDVLGKHAYTYVHPFLGGHAPPKNKNNAKTKNGNARGMSLYLLGASESSFHPLKIPESTSLANGSSLPFR